MVTTTFTKTQSQAVEVLKTLPHSTPFQSFKLFISNMPFQPQHLMCLALPIAAASQCIVTYFMKPNYTVNAVGYLPTG
jgi:hypothetical protein